ncbi:VanZ family protein [Rubritalea spongiae]|uniref:VanZ family protein n=1 Tax=Rubritalea spongiae TaxID=430797 RepID=A0ABW5E0R6_9BACT
MTTLKSLIKTIILHCQRQPIIWFAAWTLWFITLWLLSSNNPAPQNLPTIPHLDKIAHFGFFFGGAGLFCAWLRHKFHKLLAIHCIWITTLVGSIVGMLDEYHQSFTPGRTGNDPGDWLADFSGTLCGALVMLTVLKLAHRRLQKHQIAEPAQQI